MHIITLLGTGDYKETTYQWDRNGTPAEHRTMFFGAAAAAWFPDSGMTVLMTIEAEKKHWIEFSARVPHAVKREIPSGLSNEELWEIFAALTEIVEALPLGEEIVFDVTHGFRSMPLLLQLGAAYLNTVKRITTRHILYGAYTNDQTPATVLDLGPFLLLLDWANAANQFSATGDARQFKPLLAERRNSPLKKAAEQMEKVSDALLLIRPAEIESPAGRLQQELTKCKEEVTDRQAIPFHLIADALGESFKPLANSDKIERQFAQIQWYVQNQHYPLGITLAREWMVSVRCQFSNEVRSVAECWLNITADPKKNGGQAPPKEWMDFLQLWLNLADLRNDVDHCGERANPRRPGTVRDAARAIPDNLRDAVVPLGIVLR